MHRDIARLRLEPGSRLTFLCDGVVEAQSKDGELFGFDRARAISTRPAAEIVEEAVRHGQADDITVVTIERKRACSAVHRSPRGTHDRCYSSRGSLG